MTSRPIRRPRRRNPSGDDWWLLAAAVGGLLWLGTRSGGKRTTTAPAVGSSGPLIDDPTALQPQNAATSTGRTDTRWIPPQSTNAGGAWHCSS